MSCPRCGEDLALVTLEPFKFYWWERGHAELMNPVPFEEAQL